MKESRRQFLTMTTAGLGITAFSAEIVRAASEEKEEEHEAPVSAPEDLMREHGVLNRILLTYEEGLSRLRSGKEISADVFHDAASLVRKFVEDYHEKLEEKFIFPAFEKRNTLVELVGTLRRQHEAGRRLTETILRISQRGPFGDAAARRRLVRACRLFIRMYRPHEAREDTVLFPALHQILTGEQLEELGEQFEEQEDKLFGEGGFDRTVERVAAIEKQLGIYDLSQFTPPAPE